MSGLRPRLNRTLFLAFGTPFGQFATMVTFGLAYASIFLINPPEEEEDDEEEEEEEDPSMEEVVRRISPVLHSKIYDAGDDGISLDGDDNKDLAWK